MIGTRAFAVAALLGVLASTADVRAGEVTVLPVAADPPAAGKAGAAKIYGARNGAFAVQIQAPAGARAIAGDLTGPGKIPASAVAVRYAHNDGPGRSAFFDGLHPEPDPKGGAAQPVWVTVQVPADAKVGGYKGKVSVGGSSMDLDLEVVDWTLPSPREFVTHVGLIQSPDSVAMQYGVEMWSDRHWQLIEKSFELMALAGTKTIYVPVQRRTHFGNEHGMVRWTKDGGKLKPDLSIVEKYIDVAVKHLGKVPVVCLYAWELDAADAGHFPASATKEARTKDRNILISVLENGKLAEGEAPAWGTAECREFWKPVFAGVRNILEKHGMAGSMMVGISGDYMPSEKAVKDLAEAAPGAKWVAHAHGRYDDVWGVPTGLQVSVWGLFGPRDPAEPAKWGWQKANYYGWQRKFPLTSFPRYGSIYGYAVSIWHRNKVGSLAMCRSLGELAMVSQGQPKSSPGCSGFDRMGADFWPVLKSGRHAETICGRYPESSWGQLNINTATPSFLAPGTDGPVSTMRFENLREGLQEVEARVFIERALVDEAKKARLGALADKAQKMLDARVSGFVKAIQNKGAGWGPWADGDWHEKSGELYRTAAEVAAKLGGK